MSRWLFCFQSNARPLVVVAAGSHIVTVFYKALLRFRYSRNNDLRDLYEQRMEGKVRDLHREKVLSERPPWL